MKRPRRQNTIGPMVIVYSCGKAEIIPKVCLARASKSTNHLVYYRLEDKGRPICVCLTSISWWSHHRYIVERYIKREAL